MTHLFFLWYSTVIPGRPARQAVRPFIMKIIVENAVARFPEFRFRKPVSWTMNHGENWAVIGPNGAGKTLFTDLIQNSIALKEGSVRHLDEQDNEIAGGIKTLVFRDIYSVSGVQSMYYQQRWNSQDASESPMASALLEGFPEDRKREYTSLFGIDELLEKRVIALSSGELRKFLITRALMSEPSVIILDNPFIGLDEVSRSSLDSMLSVLKERKGLQTILVLSQTRDLPRWIDMVLPVQDLSLLPPVTRDEFLKDPLSVSSLFPSLQEDVSLVLPGSCPGQEVSADYEYVLQLKSVSVKYGGRKIISDVDWEVKRGECWALLGENGAGKSTLLSLVCGDNPQAYANDITLFGRRRGSGESIWDIKKRIGYLSPDIHTYYMEDIPCIKVAASGFFDSIGLSRECSESQYSTAMQWMKLFQAGHLADKSFLRISYGEQRLVLLVRAFVKSPELMILDEPLHGLDAGKKKLASRIIQEYCSRPEVSLIYVTHYRDEIPACVTEFKFMKRSPHQI